MTRLSNAINRENLAFGQTEFIRADYWLLKFVRKPAGIADIGDDMLTWRLDNCDPGISTDPVIQDVKVRGVTSMQAGPPEGTDGTLSMTFKDAADQIVARWIDDWKLAAGDRDTRQSLPKSMYTADVVITKYGTSDEILRQIKLYNVMPPTGDDPADKNDADFALQTDHSLSCKYEHFQKLLG